MKSQETTARMEFYDKRSFEACVELSNAANALQRMVSYSPEVKAIIAQIKKAEDDLVALRNKMEF